LENRTRKQDRSRKDTEDRVSCLSTRSWVGGHRNSRCFGARLPNQRRSQLWVKQQRRQKKGRFAFFGEHVEKTVCSVNFIESALHEALHPNVCFSLFPGIHPGVNVCNKLCCEPQAQSTVDNDSVGERKGLSQIGFVTR
jgi:hypothetical protein